MRQYAYFTIKCSLPFYLFENDCDICFASCLDIGNINHTKILIENFSELVDKELVKKTAEWFHL